MTINDIITKHFEELHNMCKRTDVVVSQHQTSEDIFQNVIITAINKYKNKDVEEEDGLTYLRKSLAMEFHFQFNKIDNREVYVENYSCLPQDVLYE